MPIELKTANFRLTLTDSGVLELWKDRTMRVLTVGQHDPYMDAAAGELLKEMNKFPYLRAANGEDGMNFHLDLDCGMQRWIGMKPIPLLRKQLKVCGFQQADIRRVMKVFQATEHTWMARVTF